MARQTVRVTGKASGGKALSIKVISSKVMSSKVISSKVISSKVMDIEGLGGITQLLSASKRGEPGSNERLFALVYDTLRHIAANRLRFECGAAKLQPTELVHEAWLRLGGNAGGCWENRLHFFAAAAEAMRRTLIDNARSRKSLKRGGRFEQKSSIQDIELATLPLVDEVLDLNDALDEFEKIEPVKAQVVKFKFFAGMATLEIANMMELSEATIERYWAYAKAWLHCRLNT